MSKLTDKAKGISFDDVDEADEAPPPAPAGGERPRTAIGAISVSLAMGRDVEARNRELTARLRQFEDATVVEFLDPTRVHASRFANRHALSFEGPAFALLRDEIASAGRNVQPIKVRPVDSRDSKAGKATGKSGDKGGDGKPSYEIVFGHRRHRACLELGLPVAAIVEPLNDQQLFAEMERENRARDDLSAWEQGMMYRRALEQGLFSSQRQLAASIGAQSGNVSTAIQIASLPAEVVEAFRTPMELQFRWGAALKAAFERNPEGVLAAAAELAALSPRLAGKDVVARLQAAASPGTASRRDLGTTLLTSGGAVVGQWDKDAKGAITLRLKPGAMPGTKERKLLEFVQRLLG